MPLQYGSQIAEHHAVRRDAGVFDVSHMGIVDVQGAGARELLEKLLANDIGRLKEPGKALYSCMLTEDGGVLDDLVVYFLGGSSYRVVVNAGTRVKDLAWIRSHAAQHSVQIIERTELAMLAVQGPKARSLAVKLISPEGAGKALQLAPFFGAEIDGLFIARTGYTGEDGFEIMVPSGDAVQMWTTLNALGVVSCGLGARDTLRLEAGMNLYGSDMDESTHPLESGLAWTVALEPKTRSFIGRGALEAALARGVERKLVGLVLVDRGVLRSHQRVLVPDIGEGETTSGTFSPTLDRSIALARVPAATAEQVQVDVRGKLLTARVVKPPFVRRGKPLV
jgi:aminomethyltransferase